MVLFTIFTLFLVCILIFKFYGSETGVICGFFSIIGHIFPLWLKFKGGKGVASFLGLFSVVSWPLTLVFCLIWILIVKIFKYSAMGAIIAIIFNVVLFKLILFFQFSYKIFLWIPGTPFECNIIIILSIIILFRHYSNFIGFFKK